ncbi:uracil-DNA glycosylase family protein [Halosimplex aquaticum]|uniref:Uracil-DNA glycosylase family protein n=1 Tax=Halosimplex aquaticum TaxID=3026162 RepID=A0ABD5Y409_9EURY|nr:uracil-DNA glycosylase family protein [Halosimplex aquaticum]
MKNVTARQSNPFGFSPPCEPFVAGYGDANADFHVVGDHPGVHGGAESGYPFTEFDASERLQRALAEGGLLAETGEPPVVEKTFFSYLYPCVPEGVPSERDYADLENIFDSEIRAITAHVLLPVGERATRHVFANMSARPPDEVDLESQHATEIPGSGWLIVPVKDPAEWSDADEEALVESLVELRQRDYVRRADLGRFLPDDDPYMVR